MRAVELTLDEVDDRARRILAVGLERVGGVRVVLDQLDEPFDQVLRILVPAADAYPRTMVEIGQGLVVQRHGTTLPTINAAVLPHPRGRL